LEQTNTELKTKLTNYKEDGQDNWTFFRIKFNQDIFEISKAINYFAAAKTK